MDTPCSASWSSFGLLYCVVLLPWPDFTGMYPDPNHESTLGSPPASPQMFQPTVTLSNWDLKK